MILLLTACSGGLTGWVVTLGGRVTDLDGRPLEGATVQVAAAESGAWMGEATTDAEGVWTLQAFVHEDRQALLALFAEQGELQGSAWATLDTWDLGDAAEIRGGSGQTWQGPWRGMPPLALGSGAEAPVFGRLLDASTGLPVPRATVELREGWGAEESRPAVARVGTDEDGRFEVDLPAGAYTARADAEGLSTARFPLRSGVEGLGLCAPAEQAWGVIAWESSLDLDVHLTGPQADSRERFHVWEEEPRHPLVQEAVVQLGPTGAGFETVQIVELRSSGVYRLSAFDAQNATLEGSLGMGAAWPVATMCVDGDCHFDQLSPGAEGTAWQALQLDLDRDELQRPHLTSSGASPSDASAF